MPESRDLDRFSSRRVVAVTGALVIAGALYYGAFRRSAAGALSLTGAGAVAMINFRWLEALLHAVIQPGQPRFDRRSVLRLVGRLALFAGIMAALLWVPNIDPVAVALGFSALVVGLLWEGFRWARIGGG